MSDIFKGDLKDCVVYDVEIAKEVKDVEGGWDNPDGMGFASAVTYSYAKDKYSFFLGDIPEEMLDVENIDDILPVPPKEFFDEMAGKIAISFNGIKFDSRVVLGNDRILWGPQHHMNAIDGDDVKLSMLTQLGFNVTTTPDCQLGWGNYDILLEYIKARFGINTVAMAEEKLGQRSIHDGSFSLDGLAEGTFGLHKSGHGAHAPVLYRNEQFAELLDYNLHDVRLSKKIFDFIRKYGFIVDRGNRVIWL